MGLKENLAAWVDALSTSEREQLVEYLQNKSRPVRNTFRWGLFSLGAGSLILDLTLYLCVEYGVFPVHAAWPFSSVFQFIAGGCIGILVVKR
jgi:hypothetical protein